MVSSPTAADHPAAALDRVDVSLPIRAQFFTTLRTLAASLGADAGFSIDEIDDLRLAISEVVTTLVDRVHPGGEHERVLVSFELGQGALRVDITTELGQIPIELDELAAGILRSVVDDAEVSGGRVTLVKTASESGAQAVPGGPPSAAAP